jgi:hypothetical protein
MIFAARAVFVRRADAFVCERGPQFCGQALFSQLLLPFGEVLGIVHRPLKFSYCYFSSLLLSSSSFLWIEFSRTIMFLGEDRHPVHLNHAKGTAGCCTAGNQTESLQLLYLFGSGFSSCRWVMDSMSLLFSPHPASSSSRAFSEFHQQISNLDTN